MLRIYQKLTDVCRREFPDVVRQALLIRSGSIGSAKLRISFPKHFHDGVEQNVKESLLSDNPEEAIREFLNFVRGKHLKEE